jgi:DNA-binding MarR family transcriptional regulator
MGITRQSVQRLADVLVDEGLAKYVDNPAHARAKLVRPTEAGHAVIARIGPAHAAAARRLTSELGRAELHDTIEAMSELSAALDRLVPSRRSFERPGGEAGGRAVASR